MRIRFQVDMTVPAWLKLLSPVVLVLAIAGVTLLAKAEQIAPATIVDGQTLTAANLNSLRDAIKALANPACPIGYDQDTTVTAYTVCKKGADEMVRVGTGSEVFWIDRYEAGIWSNADGSGTQYGLSSISEYPASFPANGQYTVPLYAVSKSGVQPTIVLTWFQADAACEASGKRLPAGWEWLRAARGTPDPGNHDQSGGFCNTLSAGPRNAGSGTACVSRWGAQDMIGNVWEYTTEWYASPGDPGSSAGAWPDTQGGGASQGDVNGNIVSSAYAGSAGTVQGLPAVGMRGGAWVHGTSAGTYVLYVGAAPSGWHGSGGVRCVLGR